MTVIRHPTQRQAQGFRTVTPSHEILRRAHASGRPTRAWRGSDGSWTGIYLTKSGQAMGVSQWYQTTGTVLFYAMMPHDGFKDGSMVADGFFETVVEPNQLWRTKIHRLSARVLGTDGATVSYRFGKTACTHIVPVEKFRDEFTFDRVAGRGCRI